MYKLSNQPWSNLNVLQENRLSPRTAFYPEGGCQCLSGTWRFRWFSSALDATRSVIQESAELPAYADIQVPRSWQFAGYGRFLYTDEAYPFPLDPPHIPAQNETGVYKRSFSIPCAQGERYYLRLEGVESCAQVYVNGQYIGYTQGSRLPAEFELTSACVPGDNTLCIVVRQYCDGTYLEDQDMWWLGGIIRDVYLLTRRDGFLENVIADADYDASTGRGSLRLRIQSTSQVHVGLSGADGKTVLDAMMSGTDQTWQFGSVIPWNAEEPYLYRLKLEMVGADGVISEVVSLNVGFRRVEIVEGELRLNGRRLMLRGVNRHEFSPENGRVVTYEQTREDLLLMKRCHMNAVRTSHYPNAPFFYDLCDELGLYVMDECDLETHGFEIEGVPTRLVEDLAWRDAYLDRAYRTIGRDRNHACVVMWSLGNESYWGSNFFAMYDWIHQEDPTRPIHYEGDRMSTHADVTSSMYTSIGALHELDVSISGKPHILCEFCHAMGNGPGSLKEYVELMETSNRIQGYFVWEWRDHGVKTVREDGTVYYRHGGEFGEDYHSGNFCMDGLLAADSTPTPGLWAYAKMLEPLHIQTMNRKRLQGESRFAFHRVVGAKATFILRRNGAEVDCAETLLETINPGELFEVVLPRKWQSLQRKDALYTVQVKLIEGTETLGEASCVIATYCPSATVDSGSIDIQETEQAYLLSGKGFSYSISFSDARIHDYRVEDHAVMCNGPMMDFFRAYLDNDRLMANNGIARNLHSVSVTVHTAEHELTDYGAVVTLQASLGGNARNWRTPMTIRYTCFTDGTIAVRFAGRFEGDFGTKYGDEVPRIGTTLRLDGALTAVKYCGFGPDETYCDSKQQGRKDVFSTTVDRMAFPYECPQNSGNRTGTNWIALYDKQDGIVVASLEERDVCAQRCDEKDLWKAAHACDVPVRDFIELHVDLINSGLGSASCGPAHLKGYCAQTLPFDVSYAIAPLHKDIDGAVRNAMNHLSYLKEVIPC